MKVREVLELTKEHKLSDIAKEHLTVGEKVARAAMKKAGCYYKNGTRGWQFDGESDVLEQSIYDFAEPKKINRKPRAKNIGKGERSSSNKESSNKTTYINEPTLELSNKQMIEKSVERKRSSFDIDVNLMKELKIKAIVYDKRVYEMVEQAIRNYLKEL